MRELARAVRAAGWRGEGAIVALAVALAESGGDPHKVSRSGRYRGAWQLSPDHPVDPHDLEASTRYARQLFLAYGWGPWGAYQDGRYRQFLAAARAALRDV